MSRTLRVLLGWVLAMLVGVAVISQANITADMSFFLPSNPSAEQKVLVDQLKNGSVSRLLMLSIDGGNVAQRADVSRQLRDALVRQGLFVTVQNGAQESLDIERDFLLRHRYQLSPAVTPEHFTIQGLRDSVGETVDLLTSPMGSLIKPFVVRDPTGELFSLLSGLNPGSQPSLEEGVWASRDGQRALLLLQTRALGSDMDGQEIAIESVKKAFSALVEPSALKTLHLDMSGPGVFAVNSRAVIKQEVSHLFFISSVAMLALLWGVYRSVRLMLLGLIPVVSAVVAGVVAVILVHDTVFAITIGFGISLVGEAVDYSIYYFLQSSRGGMDEWRKRFWPTVRLGVLTTVFGFGALLFSGFPGLAQLGLHSLAGIVCAALVTRFVLPAVVGDKVRAPDPGRIGVFISGALLRTRVLRWPLFAMTLVALTYLLIHRHSLWTPDLSALSSVTVQEASRDVHLRSDLGAPDARYMVVVTATDKEQALQGAERAARQLDLLVQAGQIGGYDNPARFLPSQKTQQFRLNALPAADALRERLTLALVNSPLSASRLEPFLEDVEAARKKPLMTREDLEGSAFSLVVDSLLTQNSAGWTVLLPLRPAEGSSIDIPASIIRAALIGSGAVFIDMKDEFEALYGQYITEAQWLSLAGLVCIVALLAWNLRSVAKVVQVMLPLVSAVILVIAGLYATGERLNLLHLIGILLIVAVGSNYALFFVRTDGSSDMDDLAIVSLITACMTGAIGFGVLILSSVPVLHAIGVTVGPGVILALVLSASWARVQR
jgi:predicted exporter